MQHNKKPSRQDGAALLAMMLILIAGTTYALVSRLNRHVSDYTRTSSTQAALQKAKQGLLSYAMNYPDLRDNPLKGPGFLPCPDGNNDGSPESGCAVTSGTTLGRLPFRILGLADLRDSSGERLWYAVSDNFKNSQPDTTVVNSDTPGLLSVDTTGDIVVVIIAPGEPTTEIDPIKCTPPFTAQTGRPGNSAIDYLDFDNNSIADNFFITKHVNKDCPFNDRVVYITRQELMHVVEKRVLGDVAKALDQYYQDVEVYPWLANFDPLATDHDAVPNVREGYLAYNEINEVFSTRFSVSWDIRAGGDGDPFTLTPTTTMPDWNSFSPIGVEMDSVFYDLDASVAGPECGWIARDAINCVGRAQDPDPVTLQVTVLGIPVSSVSGTRYYDFDITIPSGGTPSVCVYTACPGTIRNRDVNLAADPINSFPPGTKGEVTITDSGTINTCLPFFGCWPLDPIIFLDDGTLPTEACLTDFGICLPLLVVNGGSATNVITTATDADIDIYETTFDLGVGDELPLWLTANNWHKLTLVAYSAGDAPDNPGPCIPVGIPACLTLNGVAAPIDNKHALVISAGINLTTNWPRVILDDYFELDNKNPGDDEFIKGAITSDFNDQVKVLR